MKPAIIFILTSFFLFPSSLLPQNKIIQGKQQEGVELIISNIRNKKGVIRIGVYRSDEGYPDKPSVSYSLAKDTITGGQLRIFIPFDRRGLVSFSILDDENSNGKMDYILGIMPKEGFGFSNNPRITGMKEPPFSVTSFDFSGGYKEIRVRMVYI